MTVMEQKSDSYTIAPETTMGIVSLTVADLPRAEAFYRDVLGLKSLRTGGSTLTLSADGKTPLLRLTEVPGARSKPLRSTGLYHFALLVPSRRDLARVLRRLVTRRYPLSGASDHHVSEALYLSDPDGNGIEIYRDRPRSEWDYDRNTLRMGVDPLDLQALLNEASGDADGSDGIAPGTVMGHVHLQTADLAAAKAFYHGILGFDVIIDFLPGALFVSAGGYHHHIGLNTWSGAGAPPPPVDAVGLRSFTIDVPSREELDRLAARIARAGLEAEPLENGLFVRDPSQNGVILAVENAQKT